MYSLSVGWGGIASIIDKVKWSVSCGADSRNSIFLNDTKIYPSNILSMILSNHFNVFASPEDWRVGKAIPIHMSGDRCCPINFQPIFL